MATHPPDAIDIASRLAKAEELDAEAAEQLVADIDALLAAHQDLVYAVCVRIVGNPERAMELAQDTMLTAYQKLATFRGDAQFSTWLLKIATYRCMNAVRKRKETVGVEPLFEPTDPATGVLTGLRRQERAELMRRSSAAVLDPTEQEVVFLWYTEHLPLDRITELLNLSGASGARSVLQRCRRKLEREVRRQLAVLGHGSSFVRGSVE